LATCEGTVGQGEKEEKRTDGQEDRKEEGFSSDPAQNTIIELSSKARAQVPREEGKYSWPGELMLCPCGWSKKKN
jgi:hypothetical protein